MMKLKIIYLRVSLQDLKISLVMYINKGQLWDDGFLIKFLFHFN